MAQWGFETRQIHAGAVPDPTTGARAVPIYQTTSYTFRDTAHAAALFGLEELGNIYTRIMNPTQAVFEERVAALEGGVAALAVASGQAAETVSLLNLAENGGHIVSSASLYGGTYNLLHYTLPKLGIEVSFVDDPDDLDAWQAAVRDNTKAFFAETIGNPKGDVLDFEGVSGVAHDHGIPLVVDNTVATPYLAQPLRHGADIVVHSATKFIGGHGTSIGGIIVDGGDLRLRGQRPVPGLHRARPQLSRTGVRPAARGAVPGPLRLEGPPAVPAGHRAVHRPAQLVPVPPGPRDLEPPDGASRRQRAEGGRVARGPRRSVLGVVPGPGVEPLARTAEAVPAQRGRVRSWGSASPEAPRPGRSFIEGLELFSHLANVGDVRSLAIHPASTTHSQLTEAEQVSTGVTPDLVRLCVGLETIDDILADLDAGFRAAKVG